MPIPEPPDPDRWLRAIKVTFDVGVRATELLLALREFWKRMNE
jgi:hypothetical protein